MGNPAENMSKIVHPKNAIASQFPANLPRAVKESLRFEYSQGGIVAIRRPYVEHDRVYPFDHLSLVKSGGFEFIIGAERTLISANEAIFLPGGTVHQSKNMDPSKTEVAWMRFRFTVLGTVNLLELFEIPRRMTMRMTDPPLRDIMLELIQLSAKTHTTHNPWQREARRQALGFSLLVGLLSIANAKPAMEHFIKHTQRLEPVFTHIHDNFQRPLTIAELARIACLSASRFIRVFRMATGLPPLQYIKQARLNRALELLAATDLPVAMLAEQTGWPDQFHFCRTFKAKFGISPSAYRKMQQTMMF